MARKCWEEVKRRKVKEGMEGGEEKVLRRERDFDIRSKNDKGKRGKRDRTNGRKKQGRAGTRKI